MFYDDITLVREASVKYGPLPQPIVEVGGLEKPCIADYQRTIEAMALLREQAQRGEQITQEQVVEAQKARYLDIERPLSFLGEYQIENPATGGVPVEQLGDHLQHLGTVVCLNVLEHLDDPRRAARGIHQALRDGGVVIVSVPFQFPHHPSPRDLWRFSPDALRRVFGEDDWDVLDCDWRLRIPASAGVLNLRTGEPQGIETCALIARAR